MGTVMIKNYDKQSSIPITAHQNALSCISLNNDGTILATASEKGTLIRVYQTENGNLIKELRRGAEKAEIYSIALDSSSKFLACSSDRKTIHIFSLKTQEEEKKEAEDAKNHKSVFGKITNFFGVQSAYFNSEWSFAQFRISEVKSICTFGPDSSIIVVSADGMYYQASFDPKVGGECTKLQEKDIFTAFDHN